MAAGFFFVTAPELAAGFILRQVRELSSFFLQGYASTAGFRVWRSIFPSTHFPQ